MNVWAAHEMDISDEKNEFAAQVQGFKYFFRNIIAVAILDCVRFKNFSSDLLRKFDNIEVLSIISCQIPAEQNHYEMFCRLFNKYAFSEARVNVIASTKRFASFEKKENWLSLSEQGRLKKMVSYACTRGIIGSLLCATGLFCSEKRLMKGFTASIGLIFRDIELQLESVGRIYRSMPDCLDKSKVQKIVEDAVDCEKKLGQEIMFSEIFNEVFRNDFDMTDDSVDIYIEYCGDKVLQILGYDVLYRAAFPDVFGSIRQNVIAEKVRKLFVEEQ